jgi:hypothetical protein
MTTLSDLNSFNSIKRSSSINSIMGIGASDTIRDYISFNSTFAITKIKLKFMNENQENGFNVLLSKVKLIIYYLYYIILY